MKLLKRILRGCIVTASCLLVFSCNHSVVSDEIAFTCANGNSIVYDWGFFGDASVFYKESSGEKEKLCDYLYADSNERMEIKVSDDSRIVSLFIHDSTDTEKYPHGTALYMFKMNLDGDLSIESKEIVTDVKVKSVSEVTSSTIVYITDEGSATKTF